jgi:hypothetical protein
MDQQQPSLGQEGHHAGLPDNRGAIYLFPAQRRRIEIRHLGIAQRALHLGDALRT